WNGISLLTDCATSTETVRGWAGACATAPCGAQSPRVAIARPAAPKSSTPPMITVRLLITDQPAGSHRCARYSLCVKTRPHPLPHATAAPYTPHACPAPLTYSLQVTHRF